MNWQACRQWYIELDVTWEGYKHEGANNSYWFVFKNKLNEYYGNLPEDYIEKWYIALYVFLEMDKWAYGKSGGNGVGKKSYVENYSLPQKGTEKYIYKDEGDEFYIMTNTKKMREDGLTEIWLKIKPRKDKRDLEVKGLIQNREKYGLATDGWSKYSYCIEKRVFDCSQRKMKKIADVWYDINGKQLDKFTDNDDAMSWENIVTGTEGPTLIQFICN